MRVRIDELKPGMRIVTKRGIREITGLRAAKKHENGRTVYSWFATKAHPRHAPFLIGCGDVTVEIAE